MSQEQKKGLVYMTTTTINKWGNSLAIRIPREISEIVQLNEGAQVEMHITDNKEILLRAAYPKADDNQSLRELFLSLRGKSRPESAHEEVFSESAGDEII